MAEEGRLELPRRITPTYKFSKLAPSPSWVLLQDNYIRKYTNPLTDLRHTTIIQVYY